MNSFELIDKILEGTLDAYDHATLSQKLAEPGFVETLLEQLECEEELRQYYNPQASAKIFCQRLLEKFEFKFRDSGEFLGKVLVRLDAAIGSEVLTQVPSLMAMPKPRLRAQKIQELSSHDRIRRAFARRRMIRRNHLVMATLLMAALFLNLWLTSLPICARLDSSVAGLRLQRKGQGHKITSAMPLLEGDVLETQQETILADADGKTKIELGPHSTLRFMKPRVGSFGAHYHLEQGSLSATIAPQPRESAMIFTTQHGRVVVLGTIIQLSTSAYKSSINVERGCIRWDNLMSGDSSVIKAGESQEISSVRVNFAPSAALPQIQWDVRSDQGFQGKGECFAPALTQQQTISAQGEVELDHDLKFRIKSQNSRIVKYRISRGSEVLEGDFSENIELLIKAGQWKVELSTVCQAGEVFQPEMTWLEFSAL